MPDFETVTCVQCGSEFKASPDANAARRGFCSPACALDTN
ncbi:hypothetical protein SAMN05216285_1880 [Natrinema salifodinae]|uniref:Uncharacterized protein n=1 Tax=Natrinema salifodinae TaxID=1202768 RepID=A0A1I0NLM3_9EURY|nr:hypothetical protein SAMN05216285_1880 [Natrinema salifodinae]